MKCPKCNSGQLKVPNTYHAKGMVRRVRQCKECKLRFATLEVIVGRYTRTPTGEQVLTEVPKTHDVGG